MSLIPVQPGGKEAWTGKPVAPRTSDPSIERAIRAERERLLAEAGLHREKVSHFKRPAELPFTRRERDRVTVLFGGLTNRHEQLLLSGLRGLGYKFELVPTPRKEDFQTGREFGNNGQCNPTYFTVGALINYLNSLRDEKGLSTERIISDYVFLTAGACGPCRFGMYEAEYRLALRNSGFEGFRIILFQQGGGLHQAGRAAGLEVNLDFFLCLFNGVFIGDLLNEAAYQIRPYEAEPGRTDEVLARCLDICRKRLPAKRYDRVRGPMWARLLGRAVNVAGPRGLEKLADQLGSDHFASALRECVGIIDQGIEVDYTRPKPLVKITGEFWAQTTEGDGNFNMFPFLEREGAEVLVEPVTTWVAYILNQACNRARDRRGLDEDSGPVGLWNLRRRLLLEARFHKRMLKFALAARMIKREYERLRRALGGTGHKLVCQLELVRMGHPYYNSRAGGGEGHLEIAKNIYYTNRDLAHMVLSLKPFGCMPSTQSDGVQAAVLAHYPQVIYLPIETSGEGDINAYSRTQMALGEAKAKCKTEFARAVERTGYNLEHIREYVAAHRHLRRPLQTVTKYQGVVGRAANFVLMVGKLMDQDPTLRKGSLT